MNCLALKVRLEAKDGQRLGPPTPIEAVHESLTGRGLEPEDGSPHPDFPLVPFRLDLSSDRTSVEVGRSGWVFHTEKPGSISEKAHWITELLSRVKSRRYLADSAIGTVSVESAWGLPYAGSWREMLGQYSRAFFAPSVLPAEVVDFSAIFDAKFSDSEVHVQSGPMDSRQLLQEQMRFLSPEEAPNILLFMLHMYRTSQMANLALSAGIDHAAEEAHRLESIFGGVAL